MEYFTRLSREMFSLNYEPIKAHAKFRNGVLTLADGLTRQSFSFTISFIVNYAACERCRKSHFCAGVLSIAHNSSLCNALRLENVRGRFIGRGRFLPILHHLRTVSLGSVNESDHLRDFAPLRLPR